MKWSWHGVAGVILTTCVGVGWAVSVIIITWRGTPLNDHGTTVINTLGGALIGAVATWLGLTGPVRHRHRGDDHDHQSEDR